MIFIPKQYSKELRERVAVLARVDRIEASRLTGGLDDAFALVAGRFSRRKVRVRARRAWPGCCPEDRVGDDVRGQPAGQAKG